MILPQSSLANQIARRIATNIVNLDEWFEAQSLSSPSYIKWLWSV